METITGTAAGVPFTALPPAGVIDGPAPLTAGVFTRAGPTWRNS